MIGWRVAGGVGCHRGYLYGNQGKPLGEDMIYELRSE